MASKYPATTPEIDALVQQTITRVADRWTMEVIDALYENDTLRFTQLAKLVSGVSQKMLTQTLRQMERDGLVNRVVHPVIPPHVEYSLTKLGQELSAAFCSVWKWAEKNARTIEKARAKFDAMPKAGVPKAKRA